MYSYSLVYKEEDDLMFDMEEEEMGRRGSGYKSSECLCCNSNKNNQASGELPDVKSSFLELLHQQ